MIALYRSLSNPHNALALIIGAALLSPAFAGGKNSYLEEPVRQSLDKSAVDRSANEKDNEEGLEQTLRHNFSPEDRVRLRKSLADYSKSTDPEHHQIELRRREMRESVKARFSACDKDSDNTIDRNETTECLPQVARHFNQVDTNDDGLISLDELEEAQARIVERERAIEAKMEADKAREQEVPTSSNKRKSKQADNANRKHDL